MTNQPENNLIPNIILIAADNWPRKPELLRLVQENQWTCRLAQNARELQTHVTALGEEPASSKTTGSPP